MKSHKYNQPIFDKDTLPPSDPPFPPFLSSSFFKKISIPYRSIPKNYPYYSTSTTSNIFATSTFKKFRCEEVYLGNKHNFKNILT